MEPNYSNIFKTDIGYITLGEVKEEYFLSREDWENLCNAKKGDVVDLHTDDTPLVCMGTFAELLEEKEKYERLYDKYWHKWFRKAQENHRILGNLEKLSKLLRHAMVLEGFDITNTETGEVLSD